MIVYRFSFWADEQRHPYRFDVLQNNCLHYKSITIKYL